VLQVLGSLRGKLAERLTDLVLANREVLATAGESEPRPLACCPTLEETAASLCRVDAAVTSLERAFGIAGGGACGSRTPQGALDRDGTFDLFITLVKQDRLEEASRELGRVLRMQHDRMTTATRFFSRALKADPSLERRLVTLRRQLATSSSGQVMSHLVKIFGFQAVESRTAIQVLDELPSKTNGRGITEGTGLATSS
jgi:hypothetical protein